MVQSLVCFQSLLLCPLWLGIPQVSFKPYQHFSLGRSFSISKRHMRALWNQLRLWRRKTWLWLIIYLAKLKLTSSSLSKTNRISWACAKSCFHSSRRTKRSDRPRRPTRTGIKLATTRMVHAAILTLVRKYSTFVSMTSPTKLGCKLTASCALPTGTNFN